MKKNLNAKKIVFSVLSLIIVVAVVASVLVYNSHNVVIDDSQVPYDSEVGDDNDVEFEIEPADNGLEVIENEVLESMEPVDPEENASVVKTLKKGGYWYLFDEENRVCYVFGFKDNGDVDLALFDKSNIDGEDAKYFTGTGTYTIDGDTVKMEYLPDALPQKSFELTVKDGKVLYGDVKLASHEDLSLDYPVGYFMLMDGMANAQ